MSTELLTAQLLAVPAALLINAISQVLAARFLRKISIVVSLFIGFGVGIVGLLGWEIHTLISQSSAFALPQSLDGAALAFANITIYGWSSYCYFHFVNVGEASVRLRILEQLMDSPDGVDEATLFSQYNASAIIDVRLARLVQNGQLTFLDGRYFLGKARMIWVAKTFRFAKHFVMGAPRSEPTPGLAPDLPLS